MILLFSLWVLFDHNIKKETTVFLVGFSVPIIDGRGLAGGLREGGRMQVIVSFHERKK